MLKDYASPLRSRARRARGRLLMPLFLVISIAGLMIVLAQGTPEETAVPSRADVQSESPNAGDAATTRGVFRSGETVSDLLNGVLTPAEIADLVLKCRPVYPLRNICAGRPYRIVTLGGELSRFVCDIDSDDQLVVSREKGGFSVARQPISYTTQPVTLGGSVDSSLFGAVVKAGGSESIAMQLAEVFAWDIDFFNDIQAGDSFEVVVEKRLREGKAVGSGRLLAARFTSQGELHQAYYFKDGDRAADFYDEKGRSLRKAFLKAPLSFTRISSGFTLRRRHPITRRIRPHPAIDYAAPTGTPIHSIGDGTVMFAAYKRNNGRCVKVRHPNGWSTMYNHMSRFARGIRPGRKIVQGQVVGFVGSSGLSTGPHLDFRMYRNGAPVNPLKVKSPSARPVSRANMAAFRMIVAERLAMMDAVPEQKMSGLGYGDEDPCTSPSPLS